MTVTEPALQTLAPRGTERDPSHPLEAGQLPPSVALVGRIDRRAIAAVDVAGARGEVRAIHVMDPGEDAEAFAEQWIRRTHRPVPLELLDRDGTVADTIVARLIEARRDGELPIVIVLGVLQLSHWWQRILHDGSARDIGRRIASSLGVEVEFAPVVLQT